MLKIISYGGRTLRVVAVCSEFAIGLVKRETDARFKVCWLVSLTCIYTTIYKYIIFKANQGTLFFRSACRYDNDRFWLLCNAVYNCNKFLMNNKINPRIIMKICNTISISSIIESVESFSSNSLHFENLFPAAPCKKAETPCWINEKTNPSH